MCLWHSIYIQNGKKVLEPSLDYPLQVQYLTSERCWNISCPKSHQSVSRPDYDVIDYILRAHFPHQQKDVV